MVGRAAPSAGACRSVRTARIRRAANAKLAAFNHAAAVKPASPARATISEAMSAPAPSPPLRRAREEAWSRSRSAPRATSPISDCCTAGKARSPKAVARATAAKAGSEWAKG